MNHHKVLLPTLMFMLLAGCQKKQAPAVSASEAPPVQAAIVRVESRPFTATVAVTGSLVSRAHVDVKAETTGRVVRFPKNEGDRVQAGEAVVWVDEENYKLAVGESESAVQVTEAALERARILRTHNEAELERARNLLRSGGINDRDMKAAEVAALEARAQVELAEAQLKQARAMLDVARKRLRDTVIRAPVAGEIQHRHVNPGAYVEPPTAVFTLVDNRRLELESPVPAAELAPVRPGQRVSFQVSSYPGTMFQGRVVEISPAVDTQTRSAKVRIQVDNSSGRLKAGMFAEGEVLTGVEAQAIIVPAAAVYRSDGSAKQSSVFVVEDGRAVRRAVRIGRERNGNLEIVEGLRPGDLLVAGQSIEIAEGVRLEARR